MIVLLLVGFGMLALWQIRGLVQKHWRRELICFVILWFMGFIFSVILSMGIDLPPITTIINKFITGFLGI